MAEKMGRASSSASARASSTRSLWLSVLRWIPNSTDHIIASEKRLLSLVKTSYVQEQVNIGSGPHGSKIRWFRSTGDESRFINTMAFDKNEGSPTLILVHGYGASQGLFFRNFDALANHFRVIAIDQLGILNMFNTSYWWVQLDFPLKSLCRNYWPILKQHGKATSSIIFGSNFTPQKIIRGLGPWGPNLVHRYTSARFGSYSTGTVLNEESTLLTAKARGKLCLKYIFSYGAFARSPLLHSASSWKVPTTFICGDTTG